MKTGSDYLELANQFELLALFEQNPKLKADFEKQCSGLPQAGRRSTGKRSVAGVAYETGRSHYRLQLNMSEDNCAIDDFWFPRASSE
jgi:hypothetical protein